MVKENSKLKKKKKTYQRKKNQGNKKVFNKIERFQTQIRQGYYHICTA